MFKEPKFYVDYSTAAQLELIQLMLKQWEHICEIYITNPTVSTMRAEAGSEESWRNWVANTPSLDPNQEVRKPGFVWVYRKSHGVSDETWHNCHVYMRAVRDVVNSLFLSAKL